MYKVNLVDNEAKLDFSDVLLVPQNSDISSRKNVRLTRPYHRLEIVPIIAANMDGVGTFSMARELARYKMMTALNKHYSLDDLFDYFQEEVTASYSIYSLGANKEDFEKFVTFDKMIKDNDVSSLKHVCVDVANGYTSEFTDFISKFSDAYPEYILIAGNVVTPKRTEELIEAGADIVKIGLGSGSVCTTRLMTGIGYPQLSAVVECSIAAKGAHGSIISDGGCTTPGDIVKAFGAGADFVMLGGMLAGHDEGTDNPDGDPAGTLIDGEKVVSFWGMASSTAQSIHNGGVADYRSSEGKTTFVPYRGKVKDTVSNILGGLRSACTYLGAESIDQIQHQAQFIKVNNQVNNVFK